MLARIQTMLDDAWRRQPRFVVAVGVLLVVALGYAAWSMTGDIPGSADSLVASQLGALPHSCGGLDEMVQHPDLLIDASYERLDIGFNDGVTVGEANEVLEEAGVRVIGSSGSTSVSSICVRVRGAEPDFVALDRAKKSLREHSAVRFTIMRTYDSINPPDLHNVTF